MLLEVLARGREEGGWGWWMSHVDGAGGKGKAVGCEGRKSIEHVSFEGSWQGTNIFVRSIILVSPSLQVTLASTNLAMVGHTGTLTTQASSILPSLLASWILRSSAHACGGGEVGYW